MDFIGINCLELSPDSSRPLKRVQAGLDRGRTLENRVRFSLSRYDYSTTDYINFYLIGNMVENIS
jgi:hypothetical protein